jgi:hypothetical protein
MANAFFKTIENKLHDVGHSIAGIFTAGESKALELATAAAHYVEQNGGQILRDAATAAVIAAETTPGGGMAKLAAAVTDVIAVLTTQGIPVIKSAINLAIEMALADAKQAGLINALPDTSTAG